MVSRKYTLNISIPHFERRTSDIEQFSIKGSHFGIFSFSMSAWWIAPYGRCPSVTYFWEKHIFTHIWEKSNQAKCGDLCWLVKGHLWIYLIKQYIICQAIYDYALISDLNLHQRSYPVVKLHSYSHPA